jgi:hypothetical protein
MGMHSFVFARWHGHSGVHAGTGQMSVCLYVCVVLEKSREHRGVHAGTVQTWSVYLCTVGMDGGP